MPLKPCKRPVRDAVMPHPRRAVTPPSPYALGASAPSSGRRVHQPCRHCRHLLSLLRRLLKVSGDARPDGRLPACAWGMLPVGATPLHPITGRRSLLPSSHARTSIGSPRGSLSLAGDVRGCHVPSQSHTDGLCALYPPVACSAHDKEGESPCHRHRALYAPACQHT